MRISKEEYWN